MHRQASTMRVASRASAMMLILVGAVLMTGAAPPEHANPTQTDPALELARLRNEGAAHFESGIGLKKALAAFEAALKRNPNGAIELHNLGTTERKLGNAERAEQLLRSAMQADSKLPQAAYTLGLVHRTRGDTAAAISAFEAARARAPTEPSVHYQLGRLYREQRQEAKALQSFVDALQLDPQHTGAMYQLYLYYQEHQEPDRAKAMFNEFSRVKRALTTTRKELNDDESTLSRPIVVANAPRPAKRSQEARFNVVALDVSRKATSLDVRDFDADGLEDIAVGTRDGEVHVYRNLGQQRFEAQRKLKLDVSAPVTQVLGEVLVRGEKPRVVIVAAGRLFVSTAEAWEASAELKAAGQSKSASAVLAADIDHDGDVDLVVDAFREVLLSDGAGGFKPVNYLAEKDAAQLGGFGGPVVAVDTVQRNAIDFFVHGADGRRLVIDQLGGRHALHEAKASSSIVRLVQPADFDNDGAIDLVGAAADRLAIDYHDGGYRFQPADVGVVPQLATFSVGDFDNDGWKDIISWSTAGEIRWWRNRGARQFEELPTRLSLDDAPRASLPLDMDGDGRLDVVTLLASGAAAVLWNESEGTGQAMRLNLTGLRSAPSSLHTSVEIRRGTFYEKYVSEGRTLHLPLGREPYAEVVRISWPNGFVESKLKVDAGQRWSFAESERVSGSCPSVFAWDGAAFRFVTDAFISGPMGVPMGRDGYFPVDHDEYLKIPGELLQAEHGRLRIAITEELREAVFLDRVRLLAVDHPRGTEMYPNEYLLAGDFPEFKLHVSDSAQAPRHAIDHRGHDITDFIREVDRRYPHGFRRLQYEGLAEENAVVFDLPPTAARSPHLRLFLTGWFHYFESTSLVAASQRSDLQLLWPRIEAQDKDGAWREVATIGIPSGKDKTVVVDLAGRLTPDTRRLRIRTNLALYWDRIAIDEQPAPGDVSVQAMQVQSARLRFKGFSSFEPRRTADSAGSLVPVADTHDADLSMPQPERFVYNTYRFAAPWNPLRGNYTRYGAVDDLLHDADSLMTVFGSGDELLLEFDASDLLGPAPGWQRNYLLHLDGFVKDGDKYTAHAGTLEPTPYAGMQAYPYEPAQARQIFDSPRYQEYLRTYQTRAPLRFTGPPMNSSDESTDLITEDAL
jgi:tetratricopeptide (TPR) repeat protein